METIPSKWLIVQQVNMEYLLIQTMDVMADSWNRLLLIQARDYRPISDSYLCPLILDKVE